MQVDWWILLDHSFTARMSLLTATCIQITEEMPESTLGHSSIKCHLHIVRYMLHALLHHTHPFNGLFSGTTWVSRYQKCKTNLDFTKARDSEWQWHQLEHMQVCTSLQTDNHTSTQPLSFYRPDALPVAQLMSKH